MPFIKHLFAESKIVPVMVPPAKLAIDFGKAVAEVIAKVPDKKIICIASTDLTHYGPRYGFCPQGHGSGALKWDQTITHQIDAADAAEVYNDINTKGTEGVLGAVIKW